MILALLQPLLGVLRPHKQDEPRRRQWRRAHVACALLLLGSGTFAAVTGAQKAKPHDVENAELIEASLYVWLVTLGVTLAGLEARRRRIRAAGPVLREIASPSTSTVSVMQMEPL